MSCPEYGKQCCDCTWLDENSNKDGKFECTNSGKSGYKLVSARKPASSCNGFLDCYNGRGSVTRHSLRDISRSHGYYLTTLICEELCLEEGETTRYEDNFAYMKDVMMPLIDNGVKWVEDYDKFGPQIVAAIKASDNTREICLDLYERYLKPFNECFENSLEMDEAFGMYNDMFQETKSKYCGLGQKMN